MSWAESAGMSRLLGLLGREGSEERPNGTMRKRRWLRLCPCGTQVSGRHRLPTEAGDTPWQSQLSTCDTSLGLGSLADITCCQTTNAKRTMRRMAIQTNTIPKDSNHLLLLNPNQRPMRTTRTTTPKNPMRRLECPSQRSLPSSKSATEIFLSKLSTMTTNHAA